MKFTLPAIAAAALATSLSAQSTAYVIPKGGQDYSKTEGGRSRHVPLNFAPARIQCGYDKVATGFTGTKIIRELWARPDRTAALAAAFKVDMRIILSSTGCDVRTKSLIFEDNHGSDRLEFIKRKSFSFSTFALGTTFPWAFNIQLKGDRPFIAQGRSLLVDWSTYSATNLVNTNMYIDSTVSTAVSQTGNVGTAVAYGTACNPTTMTALASGLNVGETLRTYAKTGTPGDLCISWLGAGRSAIALPAPNKGCSLLTVPVLFHWAPVQAGPGGLANFVWGTLPASLSGNKLNWQMAAFSKGSLRLTQGVEVSVGNAVAKPFLVSHRYNYGSGTTMFNPDKDAARYGWEHLGIIFEVK